MRTTEKFSASATVVIELTDENDNSPEFGQDTFSAKV
uniref:Cadherin domain-containing protein n=2 Tax=Ciona intestinalis TaxID=7719 RepID=H2XUI6_CIOIN